MTSYFLLKCSERRCRGHIEERTNYRRHCRDKVKAYLTRNSPAYREDPEHYSHQRTQAQNEHIAAKQIG